MYFILCFIIALIVLLFAIYYSNSANKIFDIDDNGNLNFTFVTNQNNQTFRKISLWDGQKSLHVYVSNQQFDIKTVLDIIKNKIKLKSNRVTIFNIGFLHRKPSSITIDNCRVLILQSFAFCYPLTMTCVKQYTNKIQIGSLDIVFIDKWHKNTLYNTPTLIFYKEREIEVEQRNEKMCYFYDDCNLVICNCMFQINNL